MTAAVRQLSIRLLGAPEVQVAGAPLSLNHQKARALLYYLAATGRPHTRDHLATLLWGDSPESNARHSLRSSLYHIAHALQAQGAAEALSRDGDLVFLKLSDEACDVTHFRRLLKAGSEHALIEAVALYRGPLLQGFTLMDAPSFEQWARFEEADVRQAYLAALRRLADLAEERQAWDEAISYMQRLVLLDSLSEETQQRLIQLYIHTGAIGQALRQYRQFEGELKLELGFTPSAATRALFSAALETRSATAPRTKTKTRRTWQALPFVGRHDILEKLLAMSLDVRSGWGVTVLVQGENGSGKSRLLDELIDTLVTGPSPWTILQGSCSPFDDLLSYGPFIEAFQDAGAGDLIDLLAESHEVAPDEQGRFLWRVLQALRVLARGTPLLLFIDDLQWANSSTLHLFGFLATRLRNLPVMLVGTVQSAEAIPALQRLVTLWRRRGDVHLLSLTSLNLEAVMTLTRMLGIDSASNEWAADTLAAWLYEKSSGSPFILGEIIAQLQAEAILTSADKGLRLDIGRWLRWRATYTLPETTHDLVAWRLANLSSDARSLLDVLAVANYPLPFALLRDFPGLPSEQVLSTLEDLVASGMVLEMAHDCFALSHNLLRETLAHHISNLRRQAIARQLAGMLEACPALQRNFSPRQAALYAVMGEDVERARRFGLSVLDELAQDNASMQTATFLHHLYDLLEPTASTEEMLHLTSALGRVHQSLGQLREAASWHRQHLDLAYKLAEPATQSAAHLELGELALVANDYQAAAVAARAGLDTARSLENTRHLTLMARGHRLLGAALAMEGRDLAAAEVHLQEAVAAQRLINNTSDLCATLFELGNVAAQRGELAMALERYEEAARTAEAAHVHYFLALAHNNFAYHSLLLGRLEDAQHALAKGHKLAETYEMFGALLHLFSTQGEVYLYMAEWAAAAEVFQRGLALAEELGNLERQAGYRAGLALAARGQGELEDAITLLENALMLIAEQGFWHLRTRIQLWLAETLLQCGRRIEAGPHLDAALETARAHDRLLLLLQGKRLQARLLAVRGDWPSANTLFAATLERASNLHLALEIARTQAAWGEAMLAYAPTPHHAHTLLARAHKAFIACHASADMQALAVVMNTR